MPTSLRTDLYELNMAASYRTRGMDGLATFSLFVRQLPASRGFLIASGIEECLDWLEDLHFGAEELATLEGLGFNESQLAALDGLEFTGDVWGVPEGRVVLANEPLVEVTAPIAEAQLVETMLLNELTFQTNVTTKAARCRLAAGSEIGLVEFGMRRAQSIDAAMLAARGSAIAGFSATSNVEAARIYGLVAAGTMAHSYIEAFEDERAAFDAFAEDFPGRSTFLVDTYDQGRGVEHAISVIKARGLEEHAAIRIDSGDLAVVTRQARAALDAAGLTGVRIMVSGALDEYQIAPLVAGGAPIDAMGIGTRLVTIADAPYLDSAYKLVEFDGRPVTKLSEGKVTLPGAKQVFRAADFHDTLGLRGEAPPAGTTPLLEPMLVGGRRQAFSVNPLEQAAARCAHELAHLPAALRELEAPEQRTPQLSSTLADLAEELHHRLRAR